MLFTFCSLSGVDPFVYSCMFTLKKKYLLVRIVQIHYFVFLLTEHDVQC